MNKKKYNVWRKEKAAIIWRAHNEMCVFVVFNVYPPVIGTRILHENSPNVSTCPTLDVRT